MPPPPTTAPAPATAAETVEPNQTNTSSSGGASSSAPFDIAYFVAGTDILAGDPLGGMDITPAGVIARDEMVSE